MQFSIVWLSQIKQVSDFRIDAQYWHPDFIQNSQLVSKQKRIKDFVCPDVSNIKSFPLKQSFNYLEIAGISLNSFRYNTLRVLAGEEPSRAYHILKPGDVVVSTVRPNRNAVAFIDREGIIASSGLTVLRAKSVEPEYLFAFCKTGYFIKCLLRANKATMYPAVSDKDILEMPFFVPSQYFRTQITKNIQKAILMAKQSKQVFAEAKELLLSELGLKNFKQAHQLTFIKPYSEVAGAGRMDAEYFQPKYQELINKIKTYKGGWSTLDKLVFLKDNNFKPKKDLWYKYIELSHISGNGEITDCITRTGNTLPSRAKRMVLTGDVIISSVEGSLSKIALIGQEYDKALCSNGFYVLKANGLNSEALLLVMKSVIVQHQLHKGCSGYILTAINKAELQKIILPVIEKSTQKHLQSMVRESLNLHKESKLLLQQSIKDVEKAIQNNE